MRKGFEYRGVPINELKRMSLEEFADLLPARQRRKINRGLREEERKIIQKVNRCDDDKVIKTHLRDMIVLPQMVGKLIGIHNGKDFKVVKIQPEMIGHYLGELAMTRKKVEHGVAGIGATRSSKYVPLK